MTSFYISNPKYRALFDEARPYALLHLALDRQDGRHISDEESWVRNIQAAYAASAILKGETIIETAARHLRPNSGSAAA